MHASKLWLHHIGPLTILVRHFVAKASMPFQAHLPHPPEHRKGDAPIGADFRARVTARARTTASPAPTIPRIGFPRPCIVGAGLAPTLEHRPYLLKSAPIGNGIDDYRLISI